MECPKCGARLIPGTVFCHRCRARVGRRTQAGRATHPPLPAPTPHAATPTPERRPPRPGRPRCMTLVAALDLAVAVIALAPAALLVATIADAEPPEAALVAGAGVGALLAGVAVVTGIGLLQLKEYGRRGQLGLAVVGLPLVPFGTVVSILLAVYLTRPRVRLLFAGERVLSTAEQDALANAVEDQGLAMAAALVGLAAAAIVLLALLSALLINLLAALPASSGAWA